MPCCSITIQEASKNFEVRKLLSYTSNRHKNHIRAIKLNNVQALFDFIVLKYTVLNTDFRKTIKDGFRSTFEQ